MPEIRVRELDLATEGSWSFADSKLRWQHRPHGVGAEFDPFPAYRHDMLVVKRETFHVESCTPPIWDVDLYVANRENMSPTNAFSYVTTNGHYNDADVWVKDPPVGLIVLSGKRTPPHPAVTRHLVAHEYGHIVEYMLEHLRHGSPHGGEVVKEYAKLRGLSESTLHHGEGGNWHNSATEIFACDFRILICNTEAEFWPHMGIPHPLELPVNSQFELSEWWNAATKTLRAEQQRLDTNLKNATIDAPAAPE